MRGAWDTGMHAMNFQLKRAHLRVVAAGLRVLVKVKGMTPARFDLLYALRQVNLRFAEPFVRKGRFFGLTQTTLTQTLGLSRQTVSKMLIRLEEMGWIKRHVCPEDARTRNVLLTEVGLSKIWHAMRWIFRGRVFLTEWERVFAGPTRHILERIQHVWRLLDHVGVWFGDRSTLLYDFGYRPPRPRSDGSPARALPARCPN